MRIRRKLLLALLAFSLGAGLLLDLVENTIVRASLHEAAALRLERESALLAGLIVPKLENLPPGGGTDWIDAWTDAAGRDLRLRATFIAPDGRVLGDSDVAASELAALENHLGRPEVQEALRSGTGRARRHSTTVGAEMSYFARRLDGPAGPAGFIRLAVPTAALEAGGGRLRASIALTALAAFALLGGVAYVLTRRVSAPVERIAAAADRVASGRLETPLHSGGGAAEVDALAASLGRMRETLLAQIRAADEERRLLDTVLSGMREGLLAIGADGRVILANASLRRDLGLGEADLKGRPLVEVLRDPEAGEAFARTLDGRVESRVGLTVRFPAERTFELLVAPLDAPDGRPLGAMGIFLDVTRLQALERLRREFIADVSHEMRTPLASLKAAVENLEGAAGAEEADRSRFLAVVRRNAERMGALLDDLTDLSLIETGAITLHVELVGVREAVGDVLAALSGRATSRRIDLSVEAPAELKVSADRRRLDQILVNVVDNAIKFNRPGGGVRIRAWADPAGGALVAVEDTGPGIQPPELEKVFQRFYRRDPSRSREAGGTGLGLAIVKHLMRLHGGSVHAENRAEGGARIVLRFPRPDQP